MLGGEIQAFGAASHDGVAYHNLTFYAISCFLSKLACRERISQGSRHRPWWLFGSYLTTEPAWSLSKSLFLLRFIWWRSVCTHWRSSQLPLIRGRKSHCGTIGKSKCFPADTLVESSHLIVFHLVVFALGYNIHTAEHDLLFADCTCMD